MRWSDWLKIALLVLIATTAKILAAAEVPVIYRFFLQGPASFLVLLGYGPYTEIRGIYTFEEFILDYSCSGIHFFLLLIAASAASMVMARRVFFSVALAAWLTTLAANTMRMALFLQLRPWGEGRPWLHEATGILVFLTLLIVYYLLLQRFLYEKRRKTA